MWTRVTLTAVVCGVVFGLAVGRLSSPAEAAAKTDGLLQPLVGKLVILSDFSNHPDLTLVGYDAQWIVLKSANYRGGLLWVPIERVQSIGGR